MSRTLASIVGCLVGLVASASAHSGEFIPGSEFSFGNWQGAGFVFDGTNEFSHCAVSAGYRSDDTLYFSINSDATISIGVSNMGWRLQPGVKVPVSVRIDRRAPFYGTAEAISSTLATLNLAEFERALTAIQKGYMMALDAEGWSGRYDLTGTFRALERAKRCVFQSLDDLKWAGSSQPGGTIPDQPIEAEPERPSSGGGVPVETAMLYQIATVMITETGAPDFRYLTEAEKTSMGLPSDAVFWTSDSRGVLGGVFAQRVGHTADLSALSVADFEPLAQGCSGDVATGSRAVMDAGFPGREIRAACSDGDASYQAYATKTLVGDTLVELMMVFSGPSASAAGSSNQRLSESVRIRSASFVSEGID